MSEIFQQILKEDFRDDMLAGYGKYSKKRGEAEKELKNLKRPHDPITTEHSHYTADKLSAEGKNPEDYSFRNLDQRERDADKKFNDRYSKAPGFLISAADNGLSFEEFIKKFEKDWKNYNWYNQWVHEYGQREDDFDLCVDMNEDLIKTLDVLGVQNTREMYRGKCFGEYGDEDKQFAQEKLKDYMAELQGKQAEYDEFCSFYNELKSEKADIKSKRDYRSKFDNKLDRVERIYKSRLQQYYNRQHELEKVMSTDDDDLAGQALAKLKELWKEANPCKNGKTQNKLFKITFNDKASLTTGGTITSMLARIEVIKPEWFIDRKMGGQDKEKYIYSLGFSNKYISEGLDPFIEACAENGFKECNFNKGYGDWSDAGRMHADKVSDIREMWKAAKEGKWKSFVICYDFLNDGPALRNNYLNHKEGCDYGR